MIKLTPYLENKIKTRWFKSNPKMSHKTDEFLGDWFIFSMAIWVIVAIPTLLGMGIYSCIVDFDKILLLTSLGVIFIFASISGFVGAIGCAIEWEKNERMRTKIKKIKNKERAAERKISDEKTKQVIRVKLTRELNELKLKNVKEGYKCSSCGAKISKRAKFCSKCGTFL